nr:MAG TPA: hypothetical protein [Caudoviricetes sp.]
MFLLITDGNILIGNDIETSINLLIIYFEIIDLIIYCDTES